MEKYKTEVKWGVIFIVVMLFWMLFESLMGWHGDKIDQHATMTNLFAIPAIAVYVFALLEKRNSDYGGFMSWKQGFISGLSITLVVVLLSPVAQLLIHYVISPDYFGNIIEYTVATNQMSAEEAEAYFSIGSYVIQGIIGALGMGIVTSAIVAVFTRKRPKQVVPDLTSTQA